MIPQIVSSLAHIVKPQASTRAPFPVAYLGHVLAVFLDVVLLVQQSVAEVLLGVRRAGIQAGHAVDDVAGQVEAVEVVQVDVQRVLTSVP